MVTESGSWIVAKYEEVIEIINRINSTVESVINEYSKIHDWLILDGVTRSLMGAYANIWLDIKHPECPERTKMLVRLNYNDGIDVARDVSRIADASRIPKNIRTMMTDALIFILKEINRKTALDRLLFKKM